MSHGRAQPRHRRRKSDFFGSPAKQSIDAPPVAAPEAADDEWVRCHDAATGASYYANRRSFEVSWTPPTATVSPPPSRTPPAAASAPAPAPAPPVVAVKDLDYRGLTTKSLMRKCYSALLAGQSGRTISDPSKQKKRKKVPLAPSYPVTKKWTFPVPPLDQKIEPLIDLTFPVAGHTTL